MSRFNFPSLSRPDKFGFMWDTDHYAQYPGFDEHCLFFDTYGDGMTQHSVEHPITAEFAADYMASLAAYLLENPERVDSVRYQFTPNYNDKDVAFAASVVYKEAPEGKRQKEHYYSIEERKITASENKRYDKRYNRVETWMDGKPEATVRLLWREYYDPLDTFVLNHQVRDWYFAHDGWMEMPKIFPDMSRDDAMHLHDAYNLLHSVLDHLTGMDYCRRGVESWKENLERQRKRQEEASNAA